jgi:phage shock protein C
MAQEPPTQTQPEPEPQPQSRPRRLYRSTHDRMFAGVAGGLAVYFGIDASLIRLAFVLLGLLSGIGVVIYIVAWVVTPEEPGHAAAHDAPQTKEAAEQVKHNVEAATSSGRRMLGLLLVLLGAFFLVRPYIDLQLAGHLWPLILVVIGLFIIFGRPRR